jgi:hypothetical protein
LPEIYAGSYPIIHDVEQGNGKQSSVASPKHERISGKTLALPIISSTIMLLGQVHVHLVILPTSIENTAAALESAKLEKSDLIVVELYSSRLW